MKIGVSSCGIVDNVFDWDIIVGVFELQLYFHFHFWNYNLGEGIYNDWPFTIMILALYNPQRLICH